MTNLEVFPNPSSEHATIEFEIAHAMHVRVSISDVLGRRLRVLADGIMNAGVQRLVWNGDNAAGKKMAAGVYLIHLQTESITRTIRFVRY